MAEDAKDPRINVILHQDFNEYDTNLLQQVKGATGCVWALGISQTQVSKESVQTQTPIETTHTNTILGNMSKSQKTSP